MQKELLKTCLLKSHLFLELHFFELNLQLQEKAQPRKCKWLGQA